MENNNLEGFYESWSSKSSDAIDYDVESSIRKADVITSHIPANLLANVRSILDFGCGYGAVLHRFKEKLASTVDVAVGVDFSNTAIEMARKRFQRESLSYYKLPKLEISEIQAFLRKTIPEGVDCILLIDLLEHVPDCKELVTGLAEFTQYFIVKLPVESSAFDNYVLPKEYPSSVHSNGHLREFDANNVHYFIRQLGLTPLYETLYIYHSDDVFPPLPDGCTFKQRLVRWLLRGFKALAVRVLPKKIYLRWVGGGGYFCLATFDSKHMLTP
jgi:SAM-dependent methyltransferase